jgi:hypothetical protein
LLTPLKERDGTALSEATESALTVGDCVFVDPGDERAPADLCGIAGSVVALRKGEAQLQVGSQNRLLWVPAELLRPDRRRKRPPTNWGSSRFDPTNPSR